jgi:hypothetical protein
VERDVTDIKTRDSHFKFLYSQKVQKQMSENENSLVPVDYSQLPATTRGSDDDFAAMSSSTDFLSRLQLFSKGGAINRNLISPGSWGIPEGDDKLTDLGKAVDVVIFARRPKALDLHDTDAIITSYDMKSKEFERIQAASGTQNSGCMYGPSFLVLERSTGRFLEWFCGTKTTRSEAKKMYPFMRVTAADIKARPALDGTEPHEALPFTMNVKLCEKGTFSWHAPVVVKCSTPFKNVPPIESIIKEMERFLNPADAGTESVDKEAAGRTRAR